MSVCAFAFHSLHGNFRVSSDCRHVAHVKKLQNPAWAWRSSCSKSSIFHGNPLQNFRTVHKSVSQSKMSLDPWSVSPEFADVLAAQAFAASLFPYLGFLYYLGKDKVNCPPLANFGFRFLLVFVGLSIPAGIWAKTHYGDILANVDWLHGGAESLLTITNLLIVLGFRKPFMSALETAGTSFAKFSSSASSKRWWSSMAAVASVAMFWVTPLLFPGSHTEPSNALSFPTWIIHVSSLLEWLAAMGLAWNYADLSGNERWRGLTWGMLPLHTSGICACTYHLFYNAASLNILVAIQAALTFFGNCTLCIAAYRINAAVSSDGLATSGTETPAVKEVLVNGPGLSLEPSTDYLLKLLVGSAFGSALVKWGSLYIDAPFEPSLALALTIISVPTLLNILKWTIRSNAQLSSLAKFF